MDDGVRTPRTFKAVVASGIIPDPKTIERLYSERLGRWKKRVNQTDPLNLIAGAFIFIERELDKIFCVVFHHKFKDMRIPIEIAPRTHLLTAMGVLTLEECRAILLLLKVRNDLIHQEEAEINGPRVHSLYNAVTKLYPEDWRPERKPTDELETLRVAVIGIFSLLHFRAGAMGYLPLQKDAQQAIAAYREHAFKNIMPFRKKVLFRA